MNVTVFFIKRKSRTKKSKRFFRIYYKRSRLTHTPLGDFDVFLIHGTDSEEIVLMILDFQPVF
jgi:hypothetical protein